MGRFTRRWNRSRRQRRCWTECTKRWPGRRRRRRRKHGKIRFLFLVTLAARRGSVGFGISLGFFGRGRTLGLRFGDQLAGALHLVASPADFGGPRGEDRVARQDGRGSIWFPNVLDA